MIVITAISIGIIIPINNVATKSRSPLLSVRVGVGVMELAEEGDDKLMTGEECRDKDGIDLAVKG